MLAAVAPHTGLTLGTGVLLLPLWNPITLAYEAAVLDQLTQRNKLPPQQLFTVAHGANHPRSANTTLEGRTKNRRIEVVIYPETADGR